MKKTSTLILTILLAMTLISCSSIVEEEEVIETFENIAEILATIPIETILPTMAPTLPPETEPPVFDEDITFACEYVRNDEEFTYALFTPSSVENGYPTPLIVWLHGAGECSVSEETFLNNGLPKALNNWSLEGFNAYILCPQLRGKLRSGGTSWNTKEAAKYLKEFVDSFISEHNVDVSNIVIVGHSLGGKGAMYMAYHMPDYFSKMVVMSGYSVSEDISEIKIPALCFTESGGGSAQFAKYEFQNIWGEENVFYLNTNHGNVPNMAFNMDNDNDNRSDLIEWMFDSN